MPTLEEKIQSGLDAGVSFEELQARMRELGLRKEDAGLEYEAAKKVGAGRLAKTRESNEWYAKEATAATSKFPSLVRKLDRESVPDLVARMAAEAVKAKGGTPIAALMKPSFKIEPSKSKVPERKIVGQPEAVDLPGEAHPDQPAVDPTDTVRPIERLIGMGKGAVQALSTPLESTRRGHEEAKYQAERAILTESAPSRFLNDIGNIVMGVPKMVASIIEPLPKETDQQEYGKELGKGVVEGALGGTLYTVSHPVDAFRANPVGTASTLLPVGKAAAELSKAAGAAKYLAPIEKVLPKVAETVVPTWTKRVLGDSRAQETAFQTGVAEELSTIGKTTRASAKQAHVESPRVPVPQAEGKPLELVLEGKPPIGSQVGGGHLVPVTGATQEMKWVPDPKDPSGPMIAAGVLGDEGKGRLPGGQAAIVMTEKRALELADDLIAKSGADSDTRQIVAQNILDWHKKNPDAPMPEVLVEPGKTVRADVSASIPEREKHAALAEQEAVKEAGRQAAQRMTQDLAPNLSSTDVHALGTGAELAAANATTMAKAKAIYDAGAPPLIPDKFDQEALRLAMTRLAAEPGIDQKRITKIIADIDTMKPVPGMGVRATEGIAKSLAPDVPKPEHLLNKAMSWVKQSLTSQNPASAINNFVSNFALQTARVGDPLTVSARLATAVKDLSAWKAGKLNPEMSKAFDFWSRTGLLDSTLLGNDVAALGEGVSWGRLATSFGMAKPLEAAYKFGDNIFKADEAVSSLNKYRRYADKLGQGETLDLAVSNNVVGRIIGGSDRAELLADGKVIRTVPKDEVLFRASAKQAQDLFFDYGEVPELAKWVRNAGPLSVASPFSTWFLKAIDIPGIKKGLGYRMLETPREIVGTTNRAIHAEEAARHLVTAAQRSATINGLRNILRDESRQDVREAVSHAPTQAKLAIVRTLGDPSYLGVQKLGNWNFLGPTELLARVGIQAAGQLGQAMDSLFLDPSIRVSEEAKVLREMQYLADPKAYDANLKRLALSAKSPDEQAEVQYLDAARTAAQKLTPSAKAEMKQAAEFNRRLNTTGYATMDDALNLIQLGGTPVSAALDEFREAGEMGKTLQAGRVFSNVMGPMLLGGFGKNTINLAARAAWRNEDGAPPWTKLLADYKLNEDDVLDQDDFLRVAIRKFTGMGWEKLAADKVTGAQIRAFAGKAKAEWKSGLGVTKADLEDLNRQIEKQKKFKNEASVKQLEAIKAHKDKVLSIVDDEMDVFDQNLQSLLDAVQVQKLPGKIVNKPQQPRYE